MILIQPNQTSQNPTYILWIHIQENIGIKDQSDALNQRRPSLIEDLLFLLFFIFLQQTFKLDHNIFSLNTLILVCSIVHYKFIALYCLRKFSNNNNFLHSFLVAKNNCHCIRVISSGILLPTGRNSTPQAEENFQFSIYLKIQINSFRN